MHHLLDSYQKLDSELIEKSGSLARHQQQVDYVRLLQQQISQQSQHVARLRSHTEYEKKQVESLTKSGLAGVWSRVTQQKDEVLVKHEVGYQQALTHEKQENQRLQTLNHDLSTANSTLWQLERDKQQFFHLKQQMDHLLDQMFLYCDQSQNHNEHELRLNVSSLTARCNELNNNVSSYDLALKHLLSAKQSLTYARDKLNSAKGTATAGLFFDGSSLFTHSPIREARNATSQSATSIQHAFQLVPSLSNSIQTASVFKSDLLTDVFFGNIITDLMQLDSIIKSLHKVDQSLEGVEVGIHLLQKTLNKLRDELAALTPQMNEYRYQLEVERHRIVNEMLVTSGRKLI